ncbi:MAG: hypothetical protein ABEJ92_11925 [Halobacteriales archaeon]
MVRDGLPRTPDRPFDGGDGALAALFDLLSDETRLRIVSVLAAHEHANPAAPPLGFAALRERVGAADSGRFNYHLRKLAGSLVEKVDGGYALTPAGWRVVTIVSQVSLGSGPERTAAVPRTG